MRSCFDCRFGGKGKCIGICGFGGDFGWYSEIYEFRRV